MTRDMVIQEHGPVDIELQRDPAQILDVAVKAAKALQGVIEAKPKKVVINGETYLEFEDWQTLGQFYGYTVKTLDAEPVEINGIRGARARAELIDFRTGEVMGGAEAYCMADEDRWADKPWFQLASMAQTRAGAKTFRNRLAWIAVLAGYKPTPFEEMTGKETAQEPEHWCSVHKTAFRKFEKNGQKWYSHKAPDGSWCNQDKPQQAPAAEDKPPSKWPDIPPFANLGAFFAWCSTEFGSNQSAVLKDLNYKNPTQIADMKDAAERIRGIHCMPPEPATTEQGEAE